MYTEQDIKIAVRKIGQRFLSEANDLKRTFDSISVELGIEVSRLNKLESGDASIEEAMALAQLFADNYPVRLGDLILDYPDHENGMKIMREEESIASGRVFSRKDKDGDRTPYYEYRDTATSKVSPFKPEWIKELRVVKDSDPENPDVAYNNGHFLHQMTAFIGPVNFYWEVDGKKYCKEMDTGSSNYITPFWKHSFTSRDPDKEAIIIAVTFASDAGKARNELYSLGNETISSYMLDNREHNVGIAQLIKQVLSDRCLSAAHIQKLAEEKKVEIDLESLVTEGAEKSNENIQKLADLLDIPSSIFELPLHELNNEVVVKYKSENDAYVLNSDEAFPDYLVYPMAGTRRMPFMNGFEFEILGSDIAKNSSLSSSLHTYIFNYGKTPVAICWEYNSHKYEDVLNPGDSAYVEPFVAHKFSCDKDLTGNLFIFRVSGEVNLSVQKELSSFASKQRIIESTSWFD